MPHALTTLLNALEALTTSSTADVDSLPPAPVAASTAAAASVAPRFVADVIQKLCRRGHAAPVAGAIIAWLMATPAPVGTPACGSASGLTARGAIVRGVLRELRDAAAVERLLEAALWRLAELDAMSVLAAVAEPLHKREGGSTSQPGALVA